MSGYRKSPLSLFEKEGSMSGYRKSLPPPFVKGGTWVAIAE